MLQSATKCYKFSTFTLRRSVDHPEAVGRVPDRSGHRTGPAQVTLGRRSISRRTKRRKEVSLGPKVSETNFWTNRPPDLPTRRAARAVMGAEVGSSAPGAVGTGAGSVPDQLRGEAKAHGGLRTHPRDLCLGLHRALPVDCPSTAASIAPTSLARRLRHACTSSTCCSRTTPRRCTFSSRRRDRVAELQRCAISA